MSSVLLYPFPPPLKNLPPLPLGGDSVAVEPLRGCGKSAFKLSGCGLGQQARSSSGRGMKGLKGEQVTDFKMCQ
jgi:hypothetical protein